MPGLHLIITTHTTRHLRRTLLGAAYLRRKPDTIVVTCDNDRADVRDLVLACSSEFAAGFPSGVRLAQRPGLGVCAASQVRNNGVREVIAAGAHAGDLLVFLDGDCCPAADWTERHADLLRHADLSIGFRYDLTPEQTELFNEEQARRGAPPATITGRQAAELGVRQRRYERSLRLRRLGLGLFIKPHKPKVLSANFGVRLDAFRAVNGFDEEYLGYGQEDDDFTRRIYRGGFRASVGLLTAVVYHQWHETRAPRAWHEGDGVARFRGTWTARCTRGLESPLAQPPVRSEWIVDGAVREAVDERSTVDAYAG